jgi:hypothetical protein
MGNEQKLTKIYIPLPEGGGPSGESFWAKPLGNDLYELWNSPFHAYNLNFLDTVRAIPDAPDEKPRIVEVVRRGGHKTLRVLFSESVPVDERQRLLKGLNRFKAYYENADDRLYAVDVEPDGDYQAVSDQLATWVQEGIIEYETVTKSSDPENPSEGTPNGL